MPNQREWYTVNNSADEVQIDIYGDIGESWWSDSVSAKQLLDAISGAKGKPITLCINSGGGSVFDAFAMMSALRAHDAKVTARVDGIAASAASFLLAAADEVIMSSVAWIMIHDATTYEYGRAEDLRKTADWMDRINDQLAGIYAKRCKRTKDEFVDAMHETTWYTADEALELGLIDSVSEAVALAACATNDKTTIDSAPQEARDMLGENVAGVMGSIGSTMLAVDNHALSINQLSDTSANIATDEGGDQEADHPDAQERVVLIDSKLYRLEN